MSPRLPTLTARQLVAILPSPRIAMRGRCSRCASRSGSLSIFRHPDGRRTTVPIHKGRDLGRGLLRQIMRDADLTVEDLTA